MDSLMVLKKPLKKIRTNLPKTKKLSILPHNCSTIGEIGQDLLELGDTRFDNEPKISFVKLYFDACLNNERLKNACWKASEGIKNPRVMSVVTTQLVMEIDYGINKND